MVPGGLQSSQEAWDPKGNNPRHMPAVTVCFIPLLLQSLGGLRCSTVSQGFSHVTSELIKVSSTSGAILNGICTLQHVSGPWVISHCSGSMSPPFLLSLRNPLIMNLLWQFRQWWREQGRVSTQTRTTVKPDFARPLQQKGFIAPKKLDTLNHSPPRPPYFQGHPKALPSGFCLWKQLMRCGMPDPFRLHLRVGVCRHLFMQPHVDARLGSR